MKIAQIAPLALPIPSKYGGVERIITDLTIGLRSNGHEVIVYSHPDSEIEGSKSFITENLKGNYMSDPPTILSHLSHFALSIRDAVENEKCDIIHSHIGYLPHFFAGFVKIPVIITLHNPIYQDKNLERKQLLHNLKYKYLVSISQNQRKDDLDLDYLANVYNGIDTKFFKPLDYSKEEYLLWVGRFDEKKGAKAAIEVAKKTNKKLLMVGPRDFVANSFFETEILPQIDGDKIIYLGEKSKTELLSLYQRAKIVLMPINWEEPFGLVTAEAMACGTPVVAFDRGATREILINEKNGYLCQPGNIDEMVARVNQIYAMSEYDYNDFCQLASEHVHQKFSLGQMVESYEEAYRKALNE